MISLVMPTYNGELYLREQLDSIYNQTMVPDEVLVVDDCSTDNTLQILQEYHDKYGLLYCINENNLGYNKNFAKAISLAKGDYISLCDQDDVWMSHKVETLYRKIREIENGEPACVSSGMTIVDANLNRYQGEKKYNEFERDSPFYLNASQGCTMMFNRKLVEAIGEIPDNIIYDAFIGYMSVLLGNRYVLGESLMFYRIHGKNAVGSALTKYKKHVTEGRVLFGLLVNGNRLNRLLLIRDIARKNEKAKEKIYLIDQAIDVFSCTNFVSFIRSIIICPYYDFWDKVMSCIFYCMHPTLIQNKIYSRS